jgi:hypothetical protein
MLQLPLVASKNSSTAIGYFWSLVSELQTCCVPFANMLCPVCKHVVSGFVLKVGVAERLMSQLGVETLLTLSHGVPYFLLMILSSSQLLIFIHPCLTHFKSNFLEFQCYEFSTLFSLHLLFICPIELENIIFKLKTHSLDNEVPQGRNTFSGQWSSSG